MDPKYDGPRDARDEDFLAAETISAPAENRKPGDMIVFPQQRLGPRPIVYVPDGSFDSLREQGKISDPNTLPGEEARDVMREKKYFLPGYTGFVRGKQHIHSRTFGETTRRAFDTPFEEHMRTSPIPSGPQCNRKVPQKTLEDTYLSNMGQSQKHVPGYTGHVPGVRASFSKTYGMTTEEQMAKFAANATIPRATNVERDNYANTSKPRNLMTIHSAPLPGTTYVCDPPQKTIPAHLNYVRFYAQ
jgi:hypothetical protein